MTKQIIIIVLVLALIYLYYQKPHLLTGNSSDTEEAFRNLRDIQTQLSQSKQLDRFNQQKIERLEEQLRTYQQGEDWETKTGEIIADLEKQKANLEGENDRLIREKKTDGQEITSLSNTLKNKTQEVNKKLEQIEQLKKDKSQSEMALNKKLEELKTKYSQREKLLDEEQTDNNKLTSYPTEKK